MGRCVFPHHVAGRHWKAVAAGRGWGFQPPHQDGREFGGYFKLNWIRTGLWSDPDDSVVPSMTEYDFGT